MGANRQPDQLRGRHRRLRAGDWPNFLLPAAAAAGPPLARRRRRAPLIPSTDFTVRRPAPRRCAGGQDGALVNRRRLAARSRRPLLPARRLLAGGGLHPVDVGAARHGGHAARRRIVRLPLGASLSGPGGGCGPGPLAPGPQTPSLISAPGQYPTDIRIECSADTVPVAFSVATEEELHT